MTREDKVHIAMIPVYLAMLLGYKIKDGVTWVFEGMNKGEKIYVILCVLSILVSFVMIATVAVRSIVGSA